MQGQTIAVWFSCGAASAVAAKLTLDRYGDLNDVCVVNNPVAEEHPDNIRFLRDVEAWLGCEIKFATNKKYPNASAVEVWEARSYMSGPSGAPCTTYLKKEARQQWETRHRPDYHVLGFTSEEHRRHERFVLTERNNVLPVLIQAGYTKQDCIDILIDAGIRPPAMYGEGFPNANCIGCVKAGSATYWNHVRRLYPGVFEQRAALSRKLGARLVYHKGRRIFLDQLPKEAVGRPMKTMTIECGSFCEEQEQNVTTFYHPTKDAALLGAAIYEEHFYVKTELEPNNGWVIVLTPKSLGVLAYPLLPLLDHVEIEFSSGRLRKRPAEHREQEPLPPPKSKGDKSPMGGDSGPPAKPLSGATARARAIADELHSASPLTRADRAKVVKACVDAGINESTAATQWSKWAKAAGL